MGYLGWVVIGLTAYGFMTVILKVSLRDIPPGVAVVINNIFLTTAAIVWVMVRGQSITDHIKFNQPFLLMLLAGVFLTIAVISLYTALSKGPASVVVPVYAMNMAVAAVLGITLLGEAVTATRVAGILMAGGAVFLLTR